MWTRERSVGGKDVSASKDKERGIWKIYLRYVDWQGIKQIHTKCGFATKREASEYERKFLASKSRDLNMLFESFVEIYLNDLRLKIKCNTYVTKVHT
ncbi:Arm DNA-binding domain-containing protein [Filifactor alocis]|uniref:Arm DNA-binding domain-containing protein n=1 Tax=Filifactor alocis TaxID=143361 RepID=UPI003F9EC918